MRHFDFRKIYLALFFTIITGASTLYALDLSLNNRNHAVLSNNALEAFSRNSIIPLQNLYPWMESVDYLEVQSGANRVYWDNWNGARLVNRDGIWEVQVGRDIFSNPDRISVHGVRRNITSISIWSAVDNPGIKDDLLSALSLRDVTVNWKDISRLDFILSNPPPEGLPHLLLLDQFQLLRLDTRFTDSIPISTKISKWLISSEISADNPGNLIYPLAADAYQPEAALLFLLAENPNLFDAEGKLPGNLISFFDWAAASRKTNLIVTDLPITTLSAGAASSAIRLPSSIEPQNSEEEQLTQIHPPEGTVNIIRRQYAAIPFGISPSDSHTAELVLSDAARFIRIPDGNNAVVIPEDPRILRFYEAYERIGRLAISGQLNSLEAVNLINQYIE